MKEVAVMVPEDRVPEFYERHGRWLASLEGEQPSPSLPQGRRIPWTQGDTAAAKHVWMGSPARCREVLAVIVERGEERADYLIERLGLRDGQELGGLLAWPGRLASQAGRKKPVRRRREVDGTIYYMEPHVRALFRQTSNAE